MNLGKIKIYGAKAPQTPVLPVSETSNNRNSIEWPKPSLNYVYLCFCDDDYEPVVFDNEESAQEWVLENAYGYDDDPDIVDEDPDAQEKNLRTYFEGCGWDTIDYHCWYGKYEVRQ